MSVFGTNEKFQDDEIMLSIYSDFYGSNIQCGYYYFKPTTFLNFLDLEIPCKKELILTLTENDFD